MLRDCHVGQSHCRSAAIKSLEADLMLGRAEPGPVAVAASFINRSRSPGLHVLLKGLPSPCVHGVLASINKACVSLEPVLCTKDPGIPIGPRTDQRGGFWSGTEDPVDGARVLSAANSSQQFPTRFGLQHSSLCVRVGARKTQSGTRFARLYP